MNNRKKLYKLITFNSEYYLKIIPSEGSILCLDIGGKRIGLAKCDNKRKISFNLKTIFRKKFSDDIIIISEIIKKEEIKSLLVGIPLNIDGKLNKKSQSIIRLTKEIINIINLPVLFWDERYSTNAAKKILIEEADLSRKKRINIIDSSAATWILEGFISKLNNIN